MRCISVKQPLDKITNFQNVKTKAKILHENLFSTYEVKAEDR
jgi:hypothetical protein